MTAKIIVTVNEKGGAGKTQSSCQLAGTLGRRGYDVLLADCDGQGSSSLWSTMNSGQNFKATCWRGAEYREQIVGQLGALSRKYDLIIVDCGAGVDVKSTWGALQVADMAIIPTKLSATDISALSATKKMMEQVWEAAERRYPAVVLPVAVKSHMKDDQAALARLGRDASFPLLRTSLGDRRAYPRSFLVGGTVHDVVTRTDPAVTEVDAFVDEILLMLSLPHSKELAKEAA